MGSIFLRGKNNKKTSFWHIDKEKPEE